MKKLAFLFSAVILVFQGCLPKKQESSTYSNVRVKTMAQHKASQHPYRASKTRTFDLLHTYLDVTPNWENQTLKGLARLTLKPYFYSTNVLILDAKGMEIKSNQRRLSVS